VNTPTGIEIEGNSVTVAPDLVFADLNKVSETIDVGATMCVVVDPKPGMYPYVCNAPGHEQLAVQRLLRR